MKMHKQNLEINISTMHKNLINNIKLEKVLLEIGDGRPPLAMHVKALCTSSIADCFY